MTKRRRWGPVLALLVVGSALVSLAFAAGVFYLMFVGVETQAVAMPEMVLDVVDEDGRPVPGARVVIEHYTQPHHVLEERVERVADEAGRVHTGLRMITERAYPLCMHGVLEHHHAVCVDHPGAMPVILELFADETPIEVTVPLRRDPSDSHACTNDLHAMSIQARTPRNDISESTERISSAAEP